MISRLGLTISRVFHKVCPDPFVIAILLTFVTLALALVWGVYPERDRSFVDRAETLLDAWRADSGIWKLLGFGMQMCLILVTGHALASTRPIRRMIAALAELPRSSGTAAAIVCLTACLTGLVNWGLALIVGAAIARACGQSLQRRGIPVHYPLVAAAGYMGLLVFHGGFSGSAPLSATTVDGAAKVLPPSAMELIGTGIALDRTIFSPLNFLVTGGLIVILPILFWLLTPKHVRDMSPMSCGDNGDDAIAAPAQTGDPEDEAPTIPDRLDRSPVVSWLLAALLLAAVVRFVQTSGWRNININTVNALMFGLGLILHGSPRAYMNAVGDGVRDCGAIIFQFPIYAGIMAMLLASGMVNQMTDLFARVGDERTMAPLMFLAATLVGLFVPSGGAQWGLQGEIALRSGLAAGVDPGVMLMSVAYGDELANMLQPFWALPLLAITGVRARDIVGYTAVAMVVAGAWMAFGLWIF